jgi:hypothetical protein
VNNSALVYGIVDTAQDACLYDLVLTCAERACLFAGELQPPLGRVAPYLVRLTSGARLTQEWQHEGWGKSWGIVLVSSRSLEELRQHFRRFLQALLPSGEVVLFRFYDPRVFRTYFPTLNAEACAEWFEAVDEFRIETEHGNGTLYCRPTGVQTMMRFE